MAMRRGTPHSRAELELELGSMPAQESVAAAALLRGTKPLLQSSRQKQLAEELARGFEARAATQETGPQPA